MSFIDKTQDIVSRDVNEVALEISKLLNEDRRTKLMNYLDSRNPNTRWEDLGYFITEYVCPDSENCTVVRIYAILFDKSEDEMRKLIRANGM